MRQIIRNKVLDKLLVNRGYVQQQLLSDTEVSYLLDETRKAYPESRFNVPQEHFSRSYVANSYTDQSSEVRAIGPKLIQRIIAPRIEELLEDYRILYCGLFVKAPMGGWLDIHYHPTVVENPKHWVIDLWCPLLDTSLSNGTLCVVPESHKLFPEIIDYPSDNILFCRDYKKNIRELHSVALPSKAGHAVIFEDSLLHWSPRNQTDTARYAIHCTCIPKEATAVHVHFDAKSPHQYEMYEGTDSFFEKDFGKPVPRPADLRLMKVIPNENRPYGYEEFLDRLGNAAHIRQELFPETNPVSPEEYSALLEQEKDMCSDFHCPTPVPVHLADETIPQQVLSTPPQEPKTPVIQEPPFLSRLTSFARKWLGEQPTVKESVAQPSEVVRDVRSTVKQHSVSDVKQYYEEWTQGYIEGFGEVFQGSRPASTDELLDYIVQAARLEDGLSVLDAGCGVCGPAIGFAQRRKLNIEAITLSEVQVQEGQKRIKSTGLDHQVKVRQGDFHQLTKLFPAKSFDRILFLESLCHAEDYHRVLEQAWQVLKPGGFIYIKDFYAIDHRSRPHLQNLHVKDLQELNRLYCLVTPNLTDTVDIISELGFDIFYMRKPMYANTIAAWQNFMRHTNTYWVRESGPAIEAIEFLAYKPMT